MSMHTAALQHGHTGWRQLGPYHIWVAADALVSSLFLSPSLLLPTLASSVVLCCGVITSPCLSGYCPHTYIYITITLEALCCTKHTIRRPYIEWGSPHNQTPESDAKESLRAATSITLKKAQFAA